MVVMKIAKVYLCLLSLVCFSSSQLDCPSNRYGIKCNMLCGDGCLNGKCNRQTGSCTCKPGWGNPLCTEQNIAGGASCNMSSTLPNSGNCSLSIDDNLDTTFRFNKSANGPNCIHSGNRDRTPTLLLDLGRIHVVNRLTVYARKGFVGRMADTEINIDRIHCTTIRKENISSQEIFDIKCTRSITGQVINITRHSNNDNDTTMNICEIQIWECQSGYYGMKCSTPCGEGCEPDTCDKYTGECRCMVGWSSPFCKECQSGYYGMKCSTPCGEGCEPDTCDKYTGECRCMVGWSSPFCKDCSTNNHGIKCNKLCGGGCQNRTCNRQTGSCTCKPGWGNPLCTEQNIARGASCNMSSTYPGSGLCSLSVDDNLDTTFRFITDPHGPNCIHTEDEDRTPTLLLDLGRVHMVNRLTVYARKDFVGRMADTEINIDKIPCTTIKDENITSKEIFDIKCAISIAGQVINITRHSKINNDFTLNICEIQIWECQSGFYDMNCSTPCGEGCKPDTCNKYTGECTCMAGWSSPFCKVCNEDTYGENCSESCGHCSNETSCNKTDGTCSSCDPGWIPPMCQEECNSTSYGQDCESICGHCEEQAGCNKINGTCTSCEPGWIPPLCQDECNSTAYGQDCQQRCGHCSNGTACNKTSGECVSCDPGWIPPLCVKECSKANYGQDCNSTCGHCSGETGCNKSDGTCPSCEPGWIPPLCQEECTNSSYGKDCQHKCGHCSEGAPCNTTSGECQSCTPGWYPPLCQNECINSFYGQDCKEKCGHCSDGAVCLKKSGVCTKCEPGWYSPLCQNGCRNGTYGQDCEHNCGHCSDGAACNKISGECLSCEPGWYPPFCQNECNDTFYGQDCKGICGHCSGEPICNKYTGQCTACEPGWNPLLCQTACNDTSYGQDCLHMCGHCSDGKHCNKVNGQCLKCELGWITPMCKEECNDTSYGQDCQQNCGHCKNGRSCNKANGHCLECDPGWIPPLCNNECNDTSYGQDCGFLCGHCLDEAACNKSDGRCMTCEPGWVPPLCQDECNDTTYGQNCLNNCGRCAEGEACNKTDGRCLQCALGWSLPLCQVQEDIKRTYVPWIVGGIFIVLVLSTIIIVAIFVLRGRLFLKSKISHDGAENNSTDSINLSCQPHRGWNPLHSIKTHRHATSDFQNATTLEISAPTYWIPSKSDKSESDTCNSMELNAASIRNAKRSQPTTSRPPRPRLAPFDFARTVISNSTNENNSAADLTDQIYVNTGTCAQALPTKSDNDNSETLAGTTNSSINMNAYPSRTQFDDLQSSLLSSLASDQLAKQFQALPKGMQYPHDEGLKPENVKKNRFKALCSYDHSRVKICRAENDSENDYINASYIKGCTQERAYIAAQGPRINTIADMWQMIWQEDVIQIVMLTNLIEGGKEKCTQYWPDSGSNQTYGRVSVKSLGEEKRADFCIRSFSLTDREAIHSRQVYQYHFLAWPDHGIPQAASLVNFWRYIKTRACSFAPLLVHCSAGVGRTGTYIALDIAMDTACSKGDVNVQQIVTRLRQDRSIMVQTEVQYTFLHEVILEACTSHATRRTFRQFDELFPGKINVSESNPTIDNEFNTLSQMKKFLPKSQNVISTKADNILKIRDTDIIPDDSHLVHLRPNTNGRNTYINAVFLPSFRQQKRNILTQLPLPDTLLDIWRLVHDMEINTIVSLESTTEEKTVKNYCHYWPNVVGDVLTTGQYAVLLNSRNVIGNKLTSYRLTLKEGKEMKYIRLLHYTDWGDDVPEETEDMVLLLETLSNVASEADCDPLLVQCLDGSSKSGLFCVLLDVISRVAIDREIDVYLPSRQVQTVRPKAIANEKQYRYSFKVAQDYKNQFKMYENT